MLFDGFLFYFSLLPTYLRQGFLVKIRIGKKNSNIVLLGVSPAAYHFLASFFYAELELFYLTIIIIFPDLFWISHTNSKTYWCPGIHGRQLFQLFYHLPELMERGENFCFLSIRSSQCCLHGYLKKKSQFLNSSINCTNVQKGGVYERASRVDFYNYDFFIYKILKIVQFPKYFGYLALENRNYISWPTSSISTSSR